MSLVPASQHGTGSLSSSAKLTKFVTIESGYRVTLHEPQTGRVTSIWKLNVVETHIANGQSGELRATHFPSGEGILPQCLKHKIDDIQLTMKFANTDSKLVIKPSFQNLFMPCEAEADPVAEFVGGTSSLSYRLTGLPVTTVCKTSIQVDCENPEKSPFPWSPEEITGWLRDATLPTSM
ncbi:hypothetical protein TREMEDRAFT_65116 [Tremella mesenterica DSM 1558]|uniref:uncharacterized protein n=1 Tax=Tremella mesenterica (strain ATCC 24925 / CBS 8224 / DSM 1558 / NBRC 9311 / NRRL Y-6157 / RJB 2259-6 / UBC 559-6) TaxID=578456 RepID=UPI00032D144F|nr:uncharacterized protein TREMEDRAFT_65116 [Tremella mesenterica DSM 1558]EIW66722.1 hypothetical protein TREMEDRAFT_65116 [Tremella mesenterica DSM 1558]